jgi:RimJ/RimL family protein N-acetyltransferase
VPALPNELFGRRLRLTRATLDDVDEVLAAIGVSFVELHTWMTWAETMPTRESLAELAHDSVIRFDSDDRWSYWIREIEGGLLVGSAALGRREVPNELEIGYWVRSDRTGRGYATEAARVLTTAAFDSDPGVATVKISMDRANGPSAAVPQKLGFERDHSYERDILTPGHSGQGVAWVVRRDAWQNRTR